MQASARRGDGYPELKCGMDVHLLHYGPPVQNAPDGVTMRQASALLPLSVAQQCLRAGGHIHHIADVVRLRACMQYTGTQECVNRDRSQISKPIMKTRAKAN